VKIWDIPIFPFIEISAMRVMMNTIDSESLSRLSKTQLDALIIETQHYYDAELAHDQRASWLLALSSGLLYAVISLITSIKKGELADNYNNFIYWLIFSLCFFSASGISFIISLWPLAGKNGNFWLHIKTQQKISTKIEDMKSYSWIIDHYVAHRNRSIKKANTIIWGAVFLVIGLLLLVGFFIRSQYGA
jgi:amino acid permease